MSEVIKVKTLYEKDTLSCRGKKRVKSKTIDLHSPESDITVTERGADNSNPSFMGHRGCHNDLLDHKWLTGFAIHRSCKLNYTYNVKPTVFIVYKAINFKHNFYFILFYLQKDLKIYLCIE